MRSSLFVFAMAAAGCVTTDDGLETSSVDSDLTVWQWTDDMQIANQDSAKQVGLASFGDLLVVHNGNTNTHELWWALFDGTKWSPNQKIANQYAEGGPALVVFQNRPTMIYRAMGENHLLLATENSLVWSAAAIAGTPIPGGTTVSSAPAAAVFQSQLYVAACEHTPVGDVVHVDRLSGGAWSGAGEFAVPAGCRYVAMAPVEGVLRVYFVDGNWTLGEALASVGTGGVEWGVRATGMKSKKPPSIVSCGNDVHLVHGGYTNANEIWWSYRANNAWVTNVKVIGQASNAGAALGCFRGTMPVMVHNGDSTNHLWWAEFHTP